MRLREADERDIPAMTAIRLGVRENRLSDPGWLTHQLWLNGLVASGNANTWVCELDAHIVGFSVARIQEQDIWALFIDPAYEARGVGGQLLDLATDWLFERGVEEIHLSTSVSSRADGFYQRQGWRRGELTAKGDVVYRLRRETRKSLEGVAG